MAKMARSVQLLPVFCGQYASRPGRCSVCLICKLRESEDQPIRRLLPCAKRKSTKTERIVGDLDFLLSKSRYSINFRVKLTGYKITILIHAFKYLLIWLWHSSCDIFPVGLDSINSIWFTLSKIVILLKFYWYNDDINHLVLLSIYWSRINFNSTLIFRLLANW